MSNTLILTLPCLDGQAAQAFADWLEGAEIDVLHVDGRNVQIPTTYPPFAWDVAEVAVDHGLANDPEVCAAVGAFLKGADAR